VSGCRAHDNPYRAQRTEALRYRLDEAGWEALLGRFAALGRRGAIVGPHGSGKTTLLAELEARLEEGGWRIRRLRLNTARRSPGADEWNAALRDAGPRDLLAIDGAEQLGALRWLAVRLASRRLGGLIVTAHAPGLLPTLFETRTHAALFSSLVSELDARAKAGDVAAAFASAKGNVRDALRALYDRASA
jgi:hypothetical protein